MNAAALAGRRLHPGSRTLARDHSGLRRYARLIVTDPTAEPTLAEAELVAALRAGDEEAFMRLVERYHAAMTRLARLYVRTDAVAEEVVQETWLAVIQGIGRFEGRSSLKTWLFRILTNQAKTRAEREGRVLPFSSVWSDTSDESALEPERFRSEDEGWTGAWTAPLPTWPGDPDDRLLSGEIRARVEEAIATLPPAQAEVITLRDVVGLDPAEVVELLGITDGNQRVLLHRARSKVRRSLERYFAEAERDGS